MDLEDHAVKLGEEAVGNHRQFDSFAWHDRPEDDDEWAIVYTENRDSGLLAQSNAAVIEEMLSPHLGDDCRAEHHHHWACGWIDGYAIRVFKAGTKEPTAAWLAWCELALAAENYPVLDEEDYSRMEYEATIENIEQAASYLVSEDAPEGWPSRLWEWFWENDQSAVENHDDQGGWPSDEQCREGLSALSLLNGEDE